MSMWLIKKRKDGGNSIISFSVPFEGILISSAIFLAFFIPILMDIRTAFFPGGIAIIIGFILFLIAKFSVFKKGFWFSFGPKMMGPKFKKLYFSGYGLLLIGVALLFLSMKIHNYG